MYSIHKKSNFIDTKDVNEDKFFGKNKSNRVKPILYKVLGQ